jgi:hypothetical protein
VLKPLIPSTFNKLVALYLSHVILQDPFPHRYIMHYIYKNLPPPPSPFQHVFLNEHN